jgi:type 1 glutamine amidotransferase
MLTEAFTTIANGCAFSIGDFMHAEGYFYDEIIDRFSEVQKQVNNRKEWLIGAKTVKYAGLYFSQDTRDMYGNNLPHRFGDHFTGTAKMLIEEHIPFEVVHHKNLATVSGEGLKVLVMPNAACLNETQAEEIRAFVKQGGGLVATYETSLYDENGNYREDFLLSDVFGASYCGNTGFYSDFLEMGEEHPVTSGLSREIPLQHQGPQLKVRAKPGAEVLARVVTPYWKDDPFNYVQLLQPPGIHTELPAVITHKYGEGRVVYLPNRTDAVYAALNISEARRLLGNAVRWAAGEEILEIEAPSCIETTLFAQEAEGRTIVHLVNTQPTEETIPVTDITARIRFKKPITKVYLAPDSTELEYSVEGDTVEVRVPKVEYHNMIVIE